jgi:hypothetical protein
MAEHVERAERFAGRLAELFGEDLVSVGLYGSAARDEFRPGSSDLNLLVIVREVDARLLRRGSALSREWVAEGNPPPLLFSEQEWRSSADVFPIEYSDIADAHLVVYGSDPFAEVEVRWEHLRHLCEHQLKAGKIALRERYLLAAEQPEEIGSLLIGSVSSFVALFRAMLRLAGRRPAGLPEEVAATVGELAGFDPAPVQQVLQARTGGSGWSVAADDAVAEGYLQAITRCSEWLDTLPKPDAQPVSG